MDIKYRLDVVTYGGEGWDSPTSADVTLTIELIERVIYLSKMLGELQASKICAFDSTPEWLEENYDAADDPNNETPDELKNDEIPFTGRLNTIELIIFKESFLWTAFINNSSVTIETDRISISEITEIKKIWDTPKDNLPVLMDTIKFDKAKEILEWRLKNE